MTKTTRISYDEDVLQAVEAPLGTSGLKATVDAAFEAALRRAAWKRMQERHRAGAVELSNEEVEAMNTPDLDDLSAGDRSGRTG